MSKIYIDGHSYQTDMVEAFIKEDSRFDANIVIRAFEELSNYQHGFDGKAKGATSKPHLINKKDLINCLMEHFQYPWAFDDMLNKISEIPVTTECHPWIPVTCRMPDKWMKVWITIKHSSGVVFTEEGRWEGLFKHPNGRTIKYPVIAWKPYYTPEPYKEEET